MLSPVTSLSSHPRTTHRSPTGPVQNRLSSGIQEVSDVRHHLMTHQHSLPVIPTKAERSPLFFGVSPEPPPISKTVVLCLVSCYFCMAKVTKITRPDSRFSVSCCEALQPIRQLGPGWTCKHVESSRLAARYCSLHEHLSREPSEWPGLRLHIGDSELEGCLLLIAYCCLFFVCVGVN